MAKRDRRAEADAEVLADEREAARADAPREAAFFDLDKTLLPGSSLFPLAREMYRRKVFVRI